ncbi:DUF6316 family protein [Aliikangiella sp. IMCC44359]|uniref:DUF6316 family protein n=1 Tax=Aliikangiella sp. IMCC44359 TaxID=3459125 RepID=UPI00403AA51C
MRLRAGEKSRPWFRSDRYYHTNDGWWFLTREKSEEGPFHTQIEAENELILYIRRLNQLSQFSKN